MNKNNLIKTLASVAILTIASNNVWAAGTTAGTDIDNVAEITYSVGGNPQTKIESSEGGNSTPGEITGNETTFVVDKKVDLLVTAPSDVSVNPETSGNLLTFTITNEGNSAEDFSFTLSEIAGGDFDPNTCTVSPATITSLAVDTATDVAVSCSIPALGTAPNGGAAGGTVANTNTAVVDLLATVTSVTATTTADDPAVVDTVFADGTGTSTDTGDSTGGGPGDRNAKHSAEGTYIVSAAGLTVRKQESITNMAFDLDDTAGNGNETDVNTGNLYHIPGSTLVYTITVTNAPGAATAQGIVLTDVVDGVTLDLQGTPTITITGTPPLGAATVNSGNNDNVETDPFDLLAGQTATLTITTLIR